MCSGVGCECMWGSFVCENGMCVYAHLQCVGGVRYEGVLGHVWMCEGVCGVLCVCAYVCAYVLETERDGGKECGKGEREREGYGVERENCFSSHFLIVVVLSASMR